MQTITQLLGCLPPVSGISQLPAPPYSPPHDVKTRCKVGLAVESMKRHMTDEGWIIFGGLERAGYHLAGHDLPIDETDVRELATCLKPSTILLQDKREWDYRPGDFRDPLAQFTNVTYLRERDDIFKLTILKDSHQRPIYHSNSAEEIGCHAWVVYYHPRIVHHLAPYTRPVHLIRTYHSINRAHLPTRLAFRKDERRFCLLSGATGGAYPLRTRLMGNLTALNSTTPRLTVNFTSHPGYHRNGCDTPNYLNLLSQYRIAICTSSKYGYALRKIIEATVCGCIVLTDLPEDEKLPMIDGNLCRIHPDISFKELKRLLKELHETWSGELQSRYSQLALEWYNHIAVGKRLASDIEGLRQSYSSEKGDGI